MNTSKICLFLVISRFPIRKGEIIVFAAGTKETVPVSLKQRFTREKSARRPRLTFLSSLDNAAEQFIMQKPNATDIIAGFPWYNSITRQTFISLPGLCLSMNDKTNCKKVFDTYLPYLKRGFFPDSIVQKNFVYYSVDAPLWFIWSLKHYFKTYQNPKELWKNYGSAVKEILNAY